MRLVKFENFNSDYQHHQEVGPDIVQFTTPTTPLEHNFGNLNWQREVVHFTTPKYGKKK